MWLVAHHLLRSCSSHSSCFSSFDVIYAFIPVIFQYVLSSSLQAQVLHMPQSMLEPQSLDGVRLVKTLVGVAE